MVSRQSVFLSLSPTTLLLNLNHDEVAAYRWTSFALFTHEFHGDLHAAIAKPKYVAYENLVLQSALGFVGIKATPKINFHVSGALLPLSPPGIVREFGADNFSEFHLWGITFRVRLIQRVQALVMLLDKSERRTKALDMIYYRAKGMYRIASPVLTAAELLLLIWTAQPSKLASGFLTLLSGSLLGLYLMK